MEITTILPPEGGPEDHGVAFPVLPVAVVSEGPGDEGESELDKRGPGEGDPQTDTPTIAILVFSIRHQNSSFIFQISSFITQILLNIFQIYNLTKLVNSLHIVLSACVKLCYMTSFFCHVTVFFHCN